MAHQIGVVIGSLRKDSFNRRLATALIGLAPAGLVFRELRIDDLPLYNQDDDADPAGPVRRLKAELTKVEALLFVTPEYNRSVPGVLKNALDHGSRPYGQNSWAHKPAGIVGVSTGRVGTAVAQQDLRHILAYLDVPAMGQPEVYLQAEGVFDGDGGLAGSSRGFLQDWMERFASWVSRWSGAGGPG